MFVVPVLYCMIQERALERRLARDRRAS